MYNALVTFIAFFMIVLLLLVSLMFGTEGGRKFYQVCAVQEQCGALK